MTRGYFQFSDNRCAAGGGFLRSDQSGNNLRHHHKPTLTLHIVMTETASCPAAVQKYFVEKVLSKYDNIKL